MRRRADGVRAGDVAAYRRFMPALMPKRSDAVVFFELAPRVECAEQTLGTVQATHPHLHVTIFHLVLWALAGTLEAHPHLNRFVAGGNVWDRDGIWLSFTAKTTLDEEGVLVEVKRRFRPQLSFVEFVVDINDGIAAARGGEQTLADKELDLFVRLPAALRRGVVRAAAAANALHVLPHSFIEDDPFFASVFVTNLGSVGVDAAFHHLYEHGTIPIFCTIGRIRSTPVVEDGGVGVGRVLPIKLTYDERVEDGLYAGLALEEFRQRIEDPARFGLLAA